MSLNHLPASSSAPRKNPLPRALLAALAIALTACDKPQAPVAPEAPAPKAPTGRLVEAQVGTTVEQRQALVQEVMQTTLGTEGDFYSRGFPNTREDIAHGSVIELRTWFGPLRGVNIVTAKQEKDGKTWRHEMVDADKDGDVDFSHRMLSWPVQRNDMSPPMMHSEINTTIDPGVQDDFATALQTALGVLKHEATLQPKK